MSVIITKHFVKSPAIGNGVLAWLFADGDQVLSGQPVARFTVESNPHDIVAPATGRLKIVTPHGTNTQGGNPIGMVHEGETGTVPAIKLSLGSAESPPRPVVADKPKAEVIPPKPVVAAPVVEQPVARRRSTIAPPLPIEVEIIEVPRAAPALNVEAPPKGRAKQKAVNRTYSVGSHQEAAIAKIAKTLSLAALEDDSIPSGVNESELIRAGIELLLGLPRPALLDVLRANREREKKGKWGRGRPRPLK